MGACTHNCRSAEDCWERGHPCRLVSVAIPATKEYTTQGLPAETVFHSTASEVRSFPLKDDVKHLEWLYNRMLNVYNENPQYDYMIRFKAILDKIKGD